MMMYLVLILLDYDATLPLLLNAKRDRINIRLGEASTAPRPRFRYVHRLKAPEGCSHVCGRFGSGGRIRINVVGAPNNAGTLFQLYFFGRL